MIKFILFIVLVSVAYFVFGLIGSAIVVGLYILKYIFSNKSKENNTIESKQSNTESEMAYEERAEIIGHALEILVILMLIIYYLFIRD